MIDTLDEVIIYYWHDEVRINPISVERRTKESQGSCQFIYII
jgi:hypothetical protein